MSMPDATIAKDEVISVAGGLAGAHNPLAMISLISRMRAR